MPNGHLKSDVYIGADHGGYAMKNEIEHFLEQEGYHVIDLGVFEAGDADYPDVAREVGEKVSETKEAFGILICGTGIGMCIVANKVKGIRAANCENEYAARKAREHNDANILCIGGRTVGLELAKSLAITFLTTPFSGDERHVRRVGKIE